MLTRFPTESPAPRFRRRPMPMVWRAGPEGTPGNATQRVTVDGEPVPTAVHADLVGDGGGAFVRAYLPAAGGGLELRTLRGVVAIVAGDR